MSIQPGTGCTAFGCDEAINGVHMMGIAILRINMS